MRKLLYSLLVVLAIVLFAFLGANIFVKYYSTKKCYRNEYKVPSCRVGIIFGAGLRRNGPSKYLKDRLDAGIKLYNAGTVQKLLLTGDNSSISYDEVSAMNEYCVRKGVNPVNIYLDYAGFDTYSSLYRAKHIFKVERALLISQNYHLDRAVFVGNMLGIKSYGFIANKGSYMGYKKNSIREYFATIKAIIDLSIGRKPKYYGDEINIDGPSNCNKKTDIQRIN